MKWILAITSKMLTLSRLPQLLSIFMAGITRRLGEHNKHSRQKAPLIPFAPYIVSTDLTESLRGMPESRIEIRLHAYNRCSTLRTRLVSKPFLGVRLLAGRLDEPGLDQPQNPRTQTLNQQPTALFGGEMVAITTLDPHNDSAMREWFEVFYSGAAAGRSNPLVMDYENLVYMLRNPNPRTKRLAYSAIVDDAIVGVMMLELPQVENSNHVEWTLLVPPQQRNLGYGTALMTFGLEQIAKTGRTIHESELDVPNGVTLQDSPGSAFALKRGFTSQHREDHLVLTLPVPPDTLATIRSSAQPHHVGYDFVSWIDGCPPEYLSDFVEMNNRMEADVPTGTLSREETTWTDERMRTTEERLAGQGYTIITTAGRASNGQFVGYSQLFVSQHNLGRVMQDDTLVMPAHRGHRIGSELKTRNLEILATDFPDSQYVHTWTADTNDTMQHINALFGFVSVEQTHVFERKDDDSNSQS